MQTCTTILSPAAPLSLSSSLSFSSLLLVLALVTPVAQAQEDAPHHHHDAAGTAAPAPMSTGEVIKIDRDAGKITLRHGPLANLGMPGMTMAFKTGEPAMLDQVKPGDHVRFVAAKAGGALTITTLQADR